jgi:hypothetical protein
MKKLFIIIKHFFFPPPETPDWKRLLPYAFMGVLTLIIIVAVTQTWEYTNTVGFCGTTCHTMPPQYETNLASVHARVTCDDCHLGRAPFAEQIGRKVHDSWATFSAMVTGTYNYPIVARNMRPARDACETCHYPEKFSDDSKRDITRFKENVDNEAYTTYLILKTGGGSSRQGLGKGIHWHVENPVFFYAVDETRQKIPYVRVVNPDGSKKEYLDIESGFDPASISDDKLEQVDCITCHNRTAHKIDQPKDAVDGLLARGLISSKLPDIRRKALQVLQQPYTSLQEANDNIAKLPIFYQNNYPDVAAAQKTDIDQVVSALQDVYKRSVYFDQKMDWDTHPNDIGHLSAAGCFRCHDGKHLTTSGEAIRLECNVCHSIPVVAQGSQFVANIEIFRGPEPQSHQNTNWITLHREVFDNTCESCHTTDDPGGTSNTSFCSNSACHGVNWEYAGFDAPKLRETLQEQLQGISPEPTTTVPAAGVALTYKDSIGPILTAVCGSCHGQTKVAGLDVTTYQALMTGAKGRAVVLPGDLGKSPLVEIQTASQRHFGQLSPDQLEQVKNWIIAGAPEK